MAEGRRRAPKFAGAAIDVVALAAVRATREAQVRAAARSCPRSSARRSQAKPPTARRFDGKTEVATFPGDLPEDPDDLFARRSAFRGLTATTRRQGRLPFPALSAALLEGAATSPLPHIRLDRALQFLLGDRLQ